MKFQILQENLEKAVSITAKFANSKAQLPILGNILISTRKSKIYISSTNLEISASVQVGAKIETDGNLSVPAKVFSDLVTNLPKGIINIESDKEQLKINSENFSSNILGMDATDFPKIPNFINEGQAISLPKSSFVNSLNKVLFSVSTDETRPVLTGVYMILDQSLTLVATDGFRLSRKLIKLDKNIDIQKKVVIPKAVLSEICRSGFSVDTLNFCVEEKDNQIEFLLGDTVLTSRLLDGEYPDYEKIIPGKCLVTITLDKEEFLRAVKLASIFARESSNIIKIKVLKDSVKISSESGQAGNQNAKVDAKVEKDGNDDFEIAFNYRYLEDFVHSVSGEEIKMEFTNSTSAGVFRDTTDSDYLHLIMPVKI